MKLIKSLLFPAVLFLVAQGAFANKTQDAKALINKVAAKLSSFKSVRYHYSREMNYFKDNYFAKSHADCYLEFDGQMVSRFQLKSDNLLQVYNGENYFSLDYTDKTYQMTEHPKQQSFAGFSYFYNSIPSFRNMLSAVAADDSVTKTAGDTMINNAKYAVIKLSMQNKQIDYLGSYMHFTKQVTIFYTLLIDPKTWLPWQIIQRGNISPGDFTKVTYTDIQTTPAKPEASSWKLTNYTTEYKPKPIAQKVQLPTIGSILPYWELPEYTAQSNKVFTSDSLKNKMVLYDFWIKNCGYCMESFSHLKELQQLYGNQAQIISINAFDPVSDVAFFYKRESPGYRMLYNGRALAQKLGVEASGYPTVMIADQQGKLVYVGSFDRKKIETILTNKF